MHAPDSTIALTYRRVSTYKQERDGVSLDVQSDQALAYIRRQQPGWRLGGDFQDTLTGRTAKRKDYQRLLDEVRQLRAAGKTVVIVAAALDRMGRDLEESVRARKELAGLDVALHCVREGGVLSTTQANLLATIAQDESDRTAARVRGTRKRHREHGYRTAARAPWGYVLEPATEKERLGGSPLSVLRPDPRTVSYVREAWQRVADGESVRQVARWIQGLTSEARDGRAFDYGTVRAMFTRVSYIARVADPKRKVAAPDLAALDLPTGRWEALIDDATWTGVQEQIARHQRMPKQAKGEYLLVGLLRCPRCKKRMQGKHHVFSSKAGRRAYWLYGCISPGKPPSGGCRFGGRADVIDGAVLDQIERRLAPWTGDKALLQAMRSRWETLRRPPERPSQGRVRTLERTIAKAQKRQDEMLSLLADKVITRERYDRGIAAEQRDIDAAYSELAELKGTEQPATLPEFDKVLASVVGDGGWLAVLKGDDIPEQRDVLAELVASVTPRRVGYGRYEVDIVWTEYGDALEAMREQAS